MTHCIGRFHEAPVCYSCNLKETCQLYTQAYSYLRQAQNEITLAVDSLEQAAKMLVNGIVEEGSK